MLAMSSPQSRVGGNSVDLDYGTTSASITVVDYDEYANDDDPSKEKTQGEMTAGIVQTEETYHIVSTESDMGKNSIRSSVSAAETANAAEKVRPVPEPKTDNDPSSSHDTETTISQAQTTESQEKPTETKQRGRPRKNPPKDTKTQRGPKKRYTDTLIIQLIDTIQNAGLNCAQAARLLDMHPRTAQRYWARYREGKPYLPSQSGNSADTNPELTTEHTLALQKLYDEDHTSTLKEAQALLRERFAISITQSDLQKHLVGHCALIMKRLEKRSHADNSPTTVEERVNWVKAINKRGIDYNNCVFIGESGFNMRIKRSFGSSRKSQPAPSTASRTSGVNVTLLGAIFAKVVLHLSLKKPRGVVAKAKQCRTQEDARRDMAKGSIRAMYIVEFLESVMDISVKNRMTGKIFVMDNAYMQHATEIDEAVEARGFRTHYLPPCSPFLTPLEFFWSKLQHGITREPFAEQDTLTLRINASARKITRSDLEEMIGRSVSFFDRCLAKEDKYFII